MRALLTTNYIHVEPFRGFITDRPRHLAFKKWIEDNKGKWVDLETNHLFNNQYNTKDGYRIFDTWIEEIEEDVRTDKNVFFVKHPKGKDKIKKIEFYDHRSTKRFMSCYSVNGNYYRISKRSSIEFILVGSTIYLSSSIGYTTIRKSNLSSREIEILKYCAKRILENEK